MGVRLAQLNALNAVALGILNALRLSMAHLTRLAYPPLYPIRLSGGCVIACKVNGWNFATGIILNVLHGQIIAF